jgi:hypothetical protein
MRESARAMSRFARLAAMADQTHRGLQDRIAPDGP